ncbi:peptidyl-prolyl cis-trans isomerase [Paraburkholderia sp. BR14262]
MPADSVVARVNGVAIGQGALDRAVRESGQADTPALRATMRQGLIARELIRQAAEHDGLASTPAVQELVERTRVDAENRLYIERHAQGAKVGDAQVRARYDAIVSSLGKQEYKARVITVRGDAAAQDVLARLRSGQRFETLATQLSIAPSRSSGGELPWVSFAEPPVEGHTQGLPLPLARAISTLSPGETQQTPVVVGDQRVIVRLDERRATAIPGYDAVKDQIRRQMENEARDDAFSRMVGALADKATLSQ